MLGAAILSAFVRYSPACADNLEGARLFCGFRVTQLPAGLDLSELLGELFADLRRGPGAVVVSSAGGAQFAQESADYRNGVFTYALLEGIRSKKADRNQDGLFQVSELRSYVIDEVQRLTHGQQKPTARRDQIEFDFALH